MDDGDEFDDFVGRVEPRLRAALFGALGPDRGHDAVAEALAWAWEHWERVRAMEHPVGYLYRVGQTRTRRRKDPTPMLPPVDPLRLPDVEPGLPASLARLSPKQRVTVMLVHGCDWSHAEVADVLGISVSMVSTHLNRALTSLRSDLQVGDHV